MTEPKIPQSYGAAAAAMVAPGAGCMQCCSAAVRCFCLILQTSTLIFLHLTRYKKKDKSATLKLRQMH